MAKIDLMGLMTAIRSYEQRLTLVLLDPALTVSQLRMLMIINGHMDVTSSFLSEQLAITKASVTGQLKELERAKVVRFTPNPDDKRSSFVHLTAVGKKRLDLALVGLKELEKKISKELPEHTVNALNRMVMGEHKKN